MIVHQFLVETMGFALMPLTAIIVTAKGLVSTVHNVNLTSMNAPQLLAFTALVTIPWVRISVTARGLGTAEVIVKLM